MNVNNGIFTVENSKFVQIPFFHHLQQLLNAKTIIAIKLKWFVMKTKSFCVLIYNKKWAWAFLYKCMIWWSLKSDKSYRKIMILLWWGKVFCEDCIYFLICMFYILDCIIFTIQNVFRIDNNLEIILFPPSSVVVLALLCSFLFNSLHLRHSH